MKLHVAPRACSTCPYRKDTPPGIWHPEEYEKLRTYDEQPGEMPRLAVFHCHQENATGVSTVCRGWLSTHRDSVAVRFGCVTGQLDVHEIPQKPEPLYYASGTEACEAGLAGVAAPSQEAQKEMRKLVQRGAGRLDERPRRGRKAR